MPDSRWCRYQVMPVATTLRPPIPEEGITSSMVMPISPNTEHLRRRRPIFSNPPFPFTNCFFWYQSDMSLRVRAERGLYDNDRAFVVDGLQHVHLMGSFSDDCAQISELFERQGPLPDSTVRAPSPSRNRPVIDMPLQPPPLRDFAHGEEKNERTRSNDSIGRGVDGVDGDGSSLPSFPPSIEAVVTMNLFGWEYDPTFQYIPFVNLWLDIDQHLSEDNIPNPVELWKEQEAIGA